MGEIVSNWKVQNGLVLEITIPANATALVYVPATDFRRVKESGRLHKLLACAFCVWKMVAHSFPWGRALTSLLLLSRNSAHLQSQQNHSALTNLTDAMLDHL